jgi:hypothetical protein
MDAPRGEGEFGLVLPLSIESKTISQHQQQAYNS